MQRGPDACLRVPAVFVKRTNSLAKPWTDVKSLLCAGQADPRLLQAQPNRSLLTHGVRGAPAEPSAPLLRRLLSRFSLNSSEPTFVQRYAWRQLELMESEGLGAEQARVRVDAEVAAAGQRELARATAKPGQAIVEGPREWLAPPPVNKKSMGAVQEEEERVLAGVLGSRA